MRIYKVNEELIIDLNKMIALEKIIGSYKLVMADNTTITLSEREYLALKQELEIEKDNDLFVNMGITDTTVKEQLDNVFGWGDK